MTVKIHTEHINGETFRLDTVYEQVNIFGLFVRASVSGEKWQFYRGVKTFLRYPNNSSVLIDCLYVD